MPLTRQDDSFVATELIVLVLEVETQAPDLVGLGDRIVRTKLCRSKRHFFDTLIYYIGAIIALPRRTAPVDTIARGGGRCVR